MKANAIPLLAIFEKKIRLEVPLFQRQSVWNKSHQWERVRNLRLIKRFRALSPRFWC